VGGRVRGIRRIRERRTVGGRVRGIRRIREEGEWEGGRDRQDQE
jgi:hypothetical protein